MEKSNPTQSDETTDTASDNASIGRFVSPRVEVELDRPYRSSQTISGIDVELIVETVSVRSHYCTDSESGRVVDMDAAADSVRAVDYTVFADDDRIIAGGETTSLIWLEDDVCPRVGATKKAKMRLVEAGFETDELDGIATTVEQSLTEFYAGIDITDAELMAKSIVFNASDTSTHADETLPEPAEVRGWIAESRQKLTTALEALDDIEELADRLESTEQNTSTHRNTLPPVDETEIKTRMYDYDGSRKHFAQRVHTFEDGTELSLSPGPLRHTVSTTNNSGQTDTVCECGSLVEAIKRFNIQIRETTQ